MIYSAHREVGEAGGRGRRLFGGEEAPRRELILRGLRRL